MQTTSEHASQAISTERRLKELGIHLPVPPERFGTYSEAMQVGSLLFLSGTSPTEFVGRLGAELDAAAGLQAARLAAMNAVAIARQHFGSLDRLKPIVRLGVSVATEGNVRDQPKVADGAAGNVGAYAVQLAKQAQLRVFATAGPADVDYVRGLGAETVVNYKTTKFEDAAPPVDAVLDTVGGETQNRSFRVLKPGGILVSVISPPPQPPGFRAAFFLVDVTAARLDTLARLLDSRQLSANVGSVLPIQEARRAHEMLAGAPHKRGKIVLTTHGVH